MNRSTLLGVACCLAFGNAPISVQANTLMGDLISGSYDFPCDSCTYSHFSYSSNPFVVDGTLETSLTIDTTSTWNVNFNADSLVLKLTFAGVGGSIFYTDDPFTGPVFTVLRGDSFGSVSGLSVNRHCTPCTPVSAYVSGESLFINWEGGGGNVGDTITVNFAVGERLPAVPVPNVGAGLPGLVFPFAVFTWWRRRRVAISARGVSC
jgi:hypothetical protein